ncbi:DUF4291 domain-containing protein [Ideonella sp.]|uniref:DUF4291 domain-containing protein n=1 Tax=Ideonella sp. TaxID=1929293 RepID=UPI0035ADFEC0
MNLPTASYLAQAAIWPTEGEHILAHHDGDTIVVYQAYRPAIGHYAIRHGRLDGPDFSLNRMSWIKPNFLWMMYRSGWGTKPGQEVTLGLRLRRAFFDEILAKAVPSSHDTQRYADRTTWQQAVAESDVRLQWDPDHAPDGAPLPRRAVQLGLRGDTLARFAHEELLEVIDMSSFVDAQRPNPQSDPAALMTPLESIYVPERRG